MAVTDEEKFSVFVNYFKNVFKNESNFDEETAAFISFNNIMEDFIISKDAVLNKLQNLKINKSPGYNNILSRILYEL